MTATTPRGGRRLQLPVYAAAARQLRGAETVEAAYWYVSVDGRLQHDRFILDDDTDARFREVVGHIVDGIDAGLFPPVPGEPELVLRDRRALQLLRLHATCARWTAIGQYEPKRDAPEYGPLRAICEPRDEDADA